jgi:hypothetical protein
VDEDEPVAPFSADRWPLGALGRAGNAEKSVLHISQTPACASRANVAVPARFVDPLKRIFWLRINTPTPDELKGDGSTRAVDWPSAGTIAGEFSGLRRFVNWLPHDVSSFADVTNDLLIQYFREVDKATKSNGLPVDLSTKRRLIRAVSMAHAFAPLLPETDRLIRPAWHDEKGTFRKTRPHSGNATQPMPEEVYVPLLHWAGKFVNDFGPDILAALTARDEMADLPLTAVSPRVEHIQLAVDEWLSDHDCLPDIPPGSLKSGCLAWKFLFESAGMRFTRTSTGAAAIAKAARAMPRAPGCPLDVPITGTINDKPWIDYLDYHRVNQWATLLQSACYIIIALGTGGRGQELLSLKTLPNGESPVERTPIGKNGAQDIRVRLVGATFKAQHDLRGRQRVDGVEARWVTNERGASAADMLHSLNRGENLFIARGTSGTGTGLLLTGDLTGDQLPKFLAAVRGLSDLHDVSDSQRLHPDTDQYMETSVFRRTYMNLAIAQEGPGLIAAARQAKHLAGGIWATEVTQGYGSRVLVSKISPSLSKDDRDQNTTNVLVDVGQRIVTGEGISGADLEAAFQLMSVLDPDGSGDLMNVVSIREWNRVAREADQSLYPVDKNGLRWYCLFRRDKAICQAGEDPDRDGCDIRCKNLGLMDRDIPEMEAEIARLREVVRSTPGQIANRAAVDADALQDLVDRHYETRRVLLPLPTVRKEMSDG